MNLLIAAEVTKKASDISGAMGIGRRGTGNSWATRSPSSRVKYGFASQQRHNR